MFVNVRRFSGLNTSMFVRIESLNILILYLALLNAIPIEDKFLFRLCHYSISSKWKTAKTAIGIH